jgi:orotate phosphoribosyltransferase
VESVKEQITRHLLEIGAVELNPNAPFTWSSGMKSPIYCDNRLTLSYPDIRRDIVRGFEELILKYYPDTEVIAGTATAGIPHAAWVSEKMNLPMVYVRGSAKGHGKKKQIEGIVKAGQKVVVIEDLISTGGSVITAANVIRSAGADVQGVVAIFTYGLKKAKQNFEAAELECRTVTDFSALLAHAIEHHYISETEKDKLQKWHENPDSEAWMA